MAITGVEPYITHGRFAVGRSILDWNECATTNHEKMVVFPERMLQHVHDNAQSAVDFPPTLFEPPAEVKVDVYFPGSFGDQGTMNHQSERSTLCISSRHVELQV